ncbi:hypothetical protein TNCT_685931 [Trichonephila clavata]|uniref:Uncharacterized protein n=1 Tax=Trichonephila clavata TaxID=2740835 RepID=A0A8X6GDX2_TRICU|nr:hypothetical protein TNCT_685931 [Trichonephila clavata]
MLLEIALIYPDSIRDTPESSVGMINGKLEFDRGKSFMFKVKWKEQIKKGVSDVSLGNCEFVFKFVVV